MVKMIDQEKYFFIMGGKSMGKYRKCIQRYGYFNQKMVFGGSFTLFWLRKNLYAKIWQKGPLGVYLKGEYLFITLYKEHG